jgi:hypothetical protein
VAQAAAEETRVVGPTFNADAGPPAGPVLSGAVLQGALVAGAARAGTVWAAGAAGVARWAMGSVGAMRGNAEGWGWLCGRRVQFWLQPVVDQSMPHMGQYINQYNREGSCKAFAPNACPKVLKQLVLVCTRPALTSRATVACGQGACEGRGAPRGRYSGCRTRRGKVPSVLGPWPWPCGVGNGKVVQPDRCMIMRLIGRQRRATRACCMD